MLKVEWTTQKKEKTIKLLWYMYNPKKIKIIFHQKPIKPVISWIVIALFCLQITYEAIKIKRRGLFLIPCDLADYPVLCAYYVNMHIQVQLSSKWKFDQKQTHHLWSNCAERIPCRHTNISHIYTLFTKHCI